MKRAFDQLNFKFEYRGRTYHRGDFDFELNEVHQFKMKFNDGTEETLFIHRNDDMYSLGIGTMSDIMDIVMQILKDQEYIEILEGRIKQLNNALRNTKRGRWVSG